MSADDTQQPGGEDKFVPAHPKMQREKVLARRELVASLRKRGASLRDIHRAVSAEGFRNEKTGKPYSLSMVHKDVQAIREMWRKDIIGNANGMQVTLWAEIQEIYKAAWSRGDMQAVIQAWDRKARIVGLLKDGLSLNVNVSKASKDLDSVVSKMDTQKLKALREVFATVEQLGMDPQLVIGQLMSAT